MGFFEFLAFLVKIGLSLIGLFVAFVASFDLWHWYEHKRRIDQEKAMVNEQMLAQKRYFESQRSKIIEAIGLLQEAQDRIPVLASQEIGRNRASSGYLTYCMEEQLSSVISGCRIKFGDYVTAHALHSLGLSRFVDFRY